MMCEHARATLRVELVFRNLPQRNTPVNSDYPSLCLATSLLPEPNLCTAPRIAYIRAIERKKIPLRLRHTAEIKLPLILLSEHRRRIPM